MGVGGCCNLIKYLLILINLVFMVAGFAAVGLFIWMLTDPSFILSMTQDENHYYYGLSIFFVVSLLLLVVAFLGCSGACRESKCALVSFFCCLLVVLVAEIVTGAWAYYNKDKLDEMVRATVKYTVHNEYGVIESKTAGFDAFQKSFECCGANGPNDWATSSYNSDGKGILSLQVSSHDKRFRVPLSCCKAGIDELMCEKEVNALFIGQNLNKNIYSKGCMETLVSAIHDNISILLAVIIGIVGIELFGLLCALMLCCAIKSNAQYKS